MQNEFYNEALIISELERRYYLYLIGGEYEKMFYTFDGDDTPGSNTQHQQNMSRIRLEVEVTEAERKRQSSHSWSDPEYKTMLDYMLKHRINAKLERDDFIDSCHEVSDLKPIWQAFGEKSVFDESIFELVEQHDWLVEQIWHFISRKQFVHQLNLKPEEDLRTNLKIMGYPLFIWLLPRWCGEIIYQRMHKSLRPMVNRMRQFSRFVSGAIAMLALDENISKKDKWMIYLLGIIGVLPNILIINIIDQETQNLLLQQRMSLKNQENSAAKLQVLEQYKFAGDATRDILTMDEIIKPHILENLELKHFDPLPYVLGYSIEEEKISRLFFQARAYALYRQLYKTGRIHSRETAIFLKKYSISKSLLKQLNESDLLALTTHINLHKRMLGDSAIASS